MMESGFIKDADLNKKVDQARLHLIYEKWPQLFKNAEKINCQCHLDHDPDFYQTVAFCGMGGSATSCDILHDIMQHSGQIPSYVIRGGNIHRCINSRSLVIVNSVSGNTEEMLSMMAKASERKAEIVAISSGGKLKDSALSNGHRHIEIPNLYLPRASLPYLLMPGLKLIDGFLEKSMNKQVSLSYKKLSKVAGTISISVAHKFNIAKKIATFLNNGFAFCFASPFLVSAASRFKNSLNENAKVHCTRESILEATHNEIVPFTFGNISNTRKVVFLRWIDDVPFVKERFRKISSFFTEIGQPWMEIEISENNLFDAIITSIYILDYSTIYMAISRNIDPSRTPAIDILKRT